MNKMLLNSLNSYFRAEKIQVSSQELELQLFSNPHSTSLYAISETLDFLKIDNVAAKIDPEQLGHLPTHFIAFIEENDETPYFAHIRQNGSDVYFNAEKRKISKEQFKKIWNGVVLLAERNVNTKKNHTWFGKWIGLILISLCTLLFWENIPLLLFALIGLFGLYTSNEIFVASNDRSSFLSDKVCGKKDGEGCDQVIKSKKYNLWNFSPNDLLFSFFAASLLHVVLNRDFTVAISLVYGLGFVGVLTSMVTQAFIIKAWCRLCLLASTLIGIQVILLSLFLFVSDSSTFLSFSQESLHLLLFTILFIAILFGIYEHRKTKTTNYKLTASEIELLKFKRSPKIVRYILKDSETIRQPYCESALRFGNIESSHTITLVLSLTCSFCDKAFRKFYAAYQKKSASLGFQLVFNHYDVAASKYNDVAATILQTYSEVNPKDALVKLERWFTIKNPMEYLKKESIRDKSVGYDQLTKQRDWCKENEIFQTPVILINESEIPYYYDASFLDDFIDVLSEEIQYSTTVEPI